MISFTILNEENIGGIEVNFTSDYPDADGEYLRDILYYLAEDDCEVAVSQSHGCLLVRLYDEGYSFIYPIALTDGADELSACDEIRLYAIREEIPLRFIDLPSDALDELSDRYLHLSVDFYDEERDAYEITLLNEASREDIPTLHFDGLTLDRLTEADDTDYARLSKDGETNRFWGYDFREDNSDPDDSSFRLESEGEFDRGVAMSFAVRREGKFVGEATLYAFDYLGGCELAIRILPEYRRLGISGRIIDGFKEQGRSLGLLLICATVMERNLSSVALCKGHFDNCTHSGDTYYFTNKT